MFYTNGVEQKEVMMPLNTFTQKVIDNFQKNERLKQQLLNLKADCRMKPVLQYNIKNRMLYYFWPKVKGKKKQQEEVDNTISIRIDPYCSARETWMVPCSEIYLDAVTGNQKQIYSLCFALHKTVLQVYEFEAMWSGGDFPSPLQLNIVGLKMFFNCEVEELCSNITPLGIDGIAMELNTKDGLGWFNFPRSQVTDFNLQNNITFNYYTQLKLDSATNNLEGLLLESRITDKLREDEHIDYKIQLMILQTAIKVMLNMVPGEVNIKDTKHKINWLQPLEALGGRSLS